MKQLMKKNDSKNLDGIFNKITELVRYRVEDKLSEIKEQRMRNDQVPVKVMIFDWLFGGKNPHRLLLVDTTVWMNENADKFFQALLHSMKHLRKKVYLCTAQLNEIERKKIITDFNTKVNKQTRIALRRIETFQAAGCLDIGSLEVDDPKVLYADPEILKAINFMDNQGKKTVLLTSDRTLRIRIRQIRDNKCKQQHDVLEMYDLSIFYNAYVDYHKLYGREI